MSVLPNKIGRWDAKQNISLDIQNDCIFVDTQAYLRVECEWDAYIVIPIANKEYVRSFFMEMYIEKDGDKPEISLWLQRSKLCLSTT